MPEVILIRPPDKVETKSQEELAAVIHEGAVNRTWQVKNVLRGVVVTSQAAETRGRKVNVLTPQDTEIVYRACHADSDLVVILTGDVRVRRDPRADPAPRRTLITIERFVRYKAASILIRSQAEVASAFSEAETQVSRLNCEDFRDARVLPLHVFAPGFDLLDLHHEEGRARFDQEFGRFANRSDELRRRWTHGPNHGHKDNLIVARLPLPTGFHWDVNNHRNPSLIANGWQAWELQNSRAYVNVSPDGAIRQGRNATRRWPKNKDRPAPKR